MASKNLAKTVNDRLKTKSLLGKTLPAKTINKYNIDSGIQTTVHDVQGVSKLVDYIVEIEQNNPETNVTEDTENMSTEIQPASIAPPPMAPENEIQAIEPIDLNSTIETNNDSLPELPNDSAPLANRNGGSLDTYTFDKIQTILTENGLDNAPNKVINYYLDVAMELINNGYSEAQANARLALMILENHQSKKHDEFMSGVMSDFNRFNTDTQATFNKIQTDIEQGFEVAKKNTLTRSEETKVKLFQTMMKSGYTKQDLMTQYPTYKSIIELV